MDAHINKDTRLCISLSGRPGNTGTRFHNYLYRALGLNYVYKAFTTRDLPAAIGGIRALDIRGCAVSMPFKEACISLIDGLDASAFGIQSVNTIVNDDGRLTGHNTDYAAVLSLLRSHGVPSSLDFELRGSGGMAKAVACALRDAGFTRGAIIARNREAGAALAAQYGFDWRSELAADATPGLVINVTPVGMAGGPEAEQLSFTETQIASARFVFDVVALPAETPLIRLARSLGRHVISGDEVMTLQALEQFVLYTGIRPEPALIAEAAEFSRRPV